MRIAVDEDGSLGHGILHHGKENDTEMALIVRDGVVRARLSGAGSCRAALEVSTRTDRAR